MELSELKERLARLDSSKLIEIVKNYRQFGYNDEIRNHALLLLEERGITKTDLQLTGNFENAKYDYVNDVFTSFKRNSKLAFLFYILFLLTRFILPQLLRNFNGSPLFVVLFVLCLVLFFIFLLVSFLDQSKFYKLTGDDYGTDGALVYLFLGMPFYIIMYSVFQNQMNEKLKTIA
jgi:hypothetical protein